MPNTIRTAPAEITDTALDEVSGGTVVKLTFEIPSTGGVATRGSADGTICKWDMATCERH